MADLPDMRISTTEREQALDTLTRHFGDGRLTVTEFDERSGQIAAAVTRGQLDTVFADLPALTPPPPAVSDTDTDIDTRHGGASWRGTAITVVPLVALALFFLVPIANSWVFFLLIPLTVMLLGKKGRGGC
ncbi:DUF1707 SHOCT-like domain-containing protein [Prescottella subtropica]|uniref:DUF1707 SHOCT-like domain-containing protein n=1 Tax=Prescottella subtropica TaxID=2545757 RepID=UPI0010F9E848|nr:DUF1707 domain-containing protein [Prescottella subtropica]